MRAFSQLFDQLERATQALGTDRGVRGLLSIGPGVGRELGFMDPDRRATRAVGRAHALAAMGGGDGGFAALAGRGMSRGRRRPGRDAGVVAATQRDAESAGVGDVDAQRVLPLAGASEVVQRELVRQTWLDLEARQCQVWHRLITGTLRVRHAPWLLARALANLVNLARP